MSYEEGWKALREERFQAAAEAFQRAAGEAEDPALEDDVHFYWGVALGRAGRATEAQRTFEEWLARRPNSPRAGEMNAMIGWIAFDRHDPGKARACFERAVSSLEPKAVNSGRAGLAALAGAATSSVGTEAQDPGIGR